MPTLGYLLFLLITSLLFLTVVRSDDCDGPYEPFEDSCYFLQSRYKRNWNGSEQYCVRQGGHLVSVTSQKELQFVWDLIDERKKSSVVRDVWIGLYNDNPDTTGTSVDAFRQGWKWSDGSEYSYSDWDVQDPGPGEQYARIGQQNYRWVATGTHDEPHHFMCEKPGTPASREIEPTPSDTPVLIPREARGEASTTSSSTAQTTSATTTTTTTEPATTTTSTTSTTSPTTTTRTTTTTTSPTTSTTKPTTTTTPLPPTTTQTTSTTTLTKSSTKTAPKSPDTKDERAIQRSTTTTAATTANIVPTNSGVIDHVGQAKNLGIILGCVLGSLLIIVIVAIFCIVFRRSCLAKKEDPYEVPLKTMNMDRTNEQLVGEMLAQGRSNVYIDTEARQQRGHISLADLNNTPNNGSNDGAYERMKYENAGVDDNIYHSIKENKNPRREPNPYYNT